MASNEDFNLLKDAALTGDKIATNKLLNDTLIEPDKIVYYLNVINQRLNKLKEINNIKGSNNIEEKIKESLEDKNNKNLKYFYLVSLKDIEPGEEILAKYTFYEF